MFKTHEFSLQRLLNFINLLDSAVRELFTVTLWLSRATALLGVNEELNILTLTNVNLSFRRGGAMYSNFVTLLNVNDT